MESEQMLVTKKQVMTVGDLRRFIEGLDDEVLLAKATVVPVHPSANVTELNVRTFGADTVLLIY